MPTDRARPKAKPIDWSFRPPSYIGVLDSKRSIVNRIEGTARRRAVEEALENGDPASIPLLVVDGQLDEGTRQAFGRIHPSMMGGEYLPRLGKREIEIARIELESVTADVISIRAREGKSRIRYSVVDEYSTRFSLAIKNSRQPLTLRQMVRLIQKSFADGDHHSECGIALSYLALNNEEGGTSLEDLEAFVKVRSDFYLQLEGVFDGIRDQYLVDHAFDGLSVSVRPFMAQFTRQEQDMLESNYGRPWHATYRGHLEEIESHDVDLLNLKNSFGPPREGWFEGIIRQLEVPTVDSDRVTANPEDEAILNVYSGLAIFSTQGIGGAMGCVIRRGSVKAYCLERFQKYGQLPSGEHSVPIRHTGSTGHFRTLFPDKELAEAASLALAAPRSPLTGLLDATLFTDLVPELSVENLRRVEIEDAWAGLSDPSHRTKAWCLVHPDEAARTGQPVDWSVQSLGNMIAILRRMAFYNQPYVARIEVLDDYPSFRMRLVLVDREITIGSQSQGSHRVPWYVDIDGHRYVVNTAIPSFAFEALRPSLKPTTRRADRQGRRTLHPLSDNTKLIPKQR